MKRLAIIGGNGMLGSDLVRHLSSTFSVTSITRENYNAHRGSVFDVLINANGNSKRFWANQNVLEDFNLSTLSVYKSLFDFKFGIYVYISSSDVYEKHNKKIYTKEENVPGISNLSAYGLHKYISEQIVENHARKYLILRCSMMLGENLKKGPIYDILTNKPLFVSNDTKLQMITTREVLDIIRLLIAKKYFNKIFNVGGRGTVSFKEINKFFSTPISFLKKAEKQEYEMNVEKLKKAYPLKTSKKYLQEFIARKTDFLKI